MIQSRLLRVGQSSVLFESPDTEVVAALEALFSGFSSATDDHVDVRVSIDSTRHDGGEVLYGAKVNGMRKCSGLSLHRLALDLTRVLNRHVLDNEPEWLHIHAGAVQQDDVTVLVLGSSFSGKSTLVASLVARGWAYLSDEQVGVMPDGALLPYPRPITLRRDSWQFFEPSWFPQSEPLPDRIEIGPARLGTVYTGPAVAPTIVVCPDVSTEEFRCEPLTSADTMARLVADTLDLERAGDAGVEAMLAIVEQAAGFSITGTELDRTLAKVAELANERREPARVIAQVRVGTDDQGLRTAGSFGWLFTDESAALYEPARGAFLVLGADGYHVWELLGEDRSSWPDGMEDSNFLRELHAAGLLSGSS